MVVMPHIFHACQDLLASSGRKHASLIVRWWVSGLLLGWLLALILSLTTSPVLGFLVLIAMEAISLLFGYASSAVEMKVSGNTRAATTTNTTTPVVHPLMSTSRMAMTSLV